MTSATVKFVKELFVVENFLPLGLIFTAIISLAFPLPGLLLGEVKYDGMPIVEFINNIVVFLISGLTLKIEELSDVIQNHKLTVLYGIVTINFTTTLLALLLEKLPFHTPEFAIGLTIFATVPTTLGVGVALTQISKGDQILSLFLTVASNMLGIATVPVLLKYYLSGGVAENIAHINVQSLAFKLSVGVLIPTIVGIAIRHTVIWMPKFTKTYRAELSMLSSSNLLMIVWMALSSSRNLFFAQSVQEILAVFASAIIMHLFYLVCNYLLVGPYGLNLPLPQMISVVIMASQKSSPVGLAVITNLQADPTRKGLFALPCLVGQLSQIFIGSYVARYFSELMTAYEITHSTSSKIASNYLPVLQHDDSDHDHDHNHSHSHSHDHDHNHHFPEVVTPLQIEEGKYGSLSHHHH